MTRNVVLYIAVSLDGFIARVDEDVSWLVGDGSDPHADIGYETFLETIDTVILGNKTYEQVCSWGEYPYKKQMSYIYSRSKQEQQENLQFTNLAPKELIQKLKQEPGKDIWLVGGASIIQPFLKDQLIDELIISIIPTCIGTGIPLFIPQVMEDQKFRFVSTRVCNGIVQNTYRRI